MRTIIKCDLSVVYYIHFIVFQTFEIDVDVLTEGKVRCKFERSSQLN